MAPMYSLASYQQAIAAGETSVSETVDACLHAAVDPEGEGERVFTRLYTHSAATEARQQDATRATREQPLQGVPVTIKDLFDVAGDTTTAGSVLLRSSAPAAKDSEVVARLRRGGAILVGRTNMTEFAFSGLGLNPHYGTPRNPYRRDEGRIPGGSSSGAAVSVTDGMALAAIGSDTGGSIRIPAALCGLTGFKPTASTVPSAGAFPLSPTLDSFGPIAASVRCCASIYEVLSGQSFDLISPLPHEVRLGVLNGYVLDDLEPEVATTFANALAHLSRSGFKVTDTSFDCLKQIPECNRGGGFPAAEAYAWHRGIIETRSQEYDPRVLTRILRGANITAEDYSQLQQQRAEIISQVVPAFADLDVWIMPTVPRVAPRIAELDSSDAVYSEANLALLRNPSVANFLDACAISIPCHRWNEAPVGITLLAPRGQDHRLLSIALAVEDALAEMGAPSKGVRPFAKRSSSRCQGDE